MIYFIYWFLFSIFFALIWENNDRHAELMFNGQRIFVYTTMWFWMLFVLIVVLVDRLKRLSD
jgi:hypothetical protein